MLRVFVALLAIFLISSQASAQSEGREFLTSCTYGVLAGALVGAATLAVEDNPDDKLHRIARGASLGLYTGILLGLYVAYWVPNQSSKSVRSEESRQLEQIQGGDEGEEYDEEQPEDPLEEYEQEPEDGYIEDYGKLMPPPRLIIYPVIENQKITGAAVNVSVFRF